MNYIIRKVRFVIISLLSMSVLACASSPAIQGSSVLVTPVTYTFSISLKNKNLASAEKELDQFLTTNKYPLLVHGTEITWSGKRGQKLAKSAMHWLTKQGTPPSKLSSNSADNQTGDIVTLTTVIHQVQAPDCGYTILGNYHSLNDGCASESMRWHSMVFPENSIAGKGRLSISAPIEP